MMGCELPPLHWRGVTQFSSTVLFKFYSGGKFSIVFDATDSARVAQKTQIDQKGAYEIFGLPISFRIQASYQKAQTSNKTNRHDIALFILRQTSSRPRPVLAEYANMLSSSSTDRMCSRFFLNSLFESLSDFVATNNRGLLLCSSHS